MFVYSIENYIDHKIKHIGLVTGVCCYSKSVIGDMRANFKNWTVGGELYDYSTMLETATNLVIERIIENAQVLEADGIIGFRLVSSDIAEGAAELIGYGTAVKLLKD